MMTWESSVFVTEAKYTDEHHPEQNKCMWLKTVHPAGRVSFDLSWKKKSFVASPPFCVVHRSLIILSRYYCKYLNEIMRAQLAKYEKLETESKVHL